MAETLGRCVESRDGRRCVERAVAEVTVGCVHEHLANGPLCEAHLGSVAKGDICCWLCWHAAEPDKHRCPVSMLEQAGARVA